MKKLIILLLLSIFSIFTFANIVSENDVNSDGHKYHKLTYHEIRRHEARQNHLYKSRYEERKSANDEEESIGSQFAGQLAAGILKASFEIAGRIIIYGTVEILVHALH